MTTYLVPAGYGEAEFVEKHSRFIGRVWRVDTEEQALIHLKEMREQHRDATHNVFAYRIRENNLQRYSDDGEPSGTSGMPTLNVFVGEDIQNVICIVTRYFGGTLLGTGGLVRAYTKAAKLALENAGISQMAQWCGYLLSTDYGFYDRAKRIFEEFECVINSTDFGSDIVIELLVREDRAEEFAEKLIDASSGNIVCEETGREFLGVRIR